MKHNSKRSKDNATMPGYAKICLVVMIIYLTVAIICTACTLIAEAHNTPSISAPTEHSCTSDNSYTNDTSDKTDSMFSDDTSGLSPSDLSLALDSQKTMATTWEELVIFANSCKQNSSANELIDSFADLILIADEMENSHTSLQKYDFTLPEGIDFFSYANNVKEMVDIYNEAPQKHCTLSYCCTDDEADGTMTIMLYVDNVKHKIEYLGQNAYVLFGGTIYDCEVNNGSDAVNHLQSGRIVRVNGIAFNDANGQTIERYYLPPSEDFDPVPLPEAPMGTETVMLHVCDVQPYEEGDIAWLLFEKNGDYATYGAPILVSMDVSTESTAE